MKSEASNTDEQEGHRIEIQIIIGYILCIQQYTHRSIYRPDIFDFDTMQEVSKLRCKIFKALISDGTAVDLCQTS